MSQDAPSIPGGEIWEEVKNDILETFGEDADVTIHPGEDHIDVRVVPKAFAEELESETDLTVVPYNALRMTIRRGSDSVPSPDTASD